MKIIFNYSESLLDVPPEVTVHTSSPAVDLLYALYFYLTSVRPARARAQHNHLRTSGPPERVSQDLDNAVDDLRGSTDSTVGVEEEFRSWTAPAWTWCRASRSCEPNRRATRPLRSVAGELNLLGDRARLRRRARPSARRSTRQRHAASRCSRSRPTRALPGGHRHTSLGRLPRATDHRHPALPPGRAGAAYVAWRNNTFSLHVHMGIRDIHRAIAVCDRLRPVLPLLLAISANSPYPRRPRHRSAFGAHPELHQIFRAAVFPMRSEAGRPTARTWSS